MPFINALLKYINTVFVETGTFYGATVYKVLNNTICKPAVIISLELSNHLLIECIKRFERNIHSKQIFIFKANTKYELYDNIKDILYPITFWLDSHWCNYPDIWYDVETVCPILEELEQIKQHPIKTHTIMVNDILLMNNSRDKNNGFPVTLDKIIKSILEINPEYSIKYYSDHIGKNNILVAYIKQNLRDLTSDNSAPLSNSQCARVIDASTDTTGDAVTTNISVTRSQLKEKICIHTYLTKTITVKQPPGFADYIRGTIALYNLSKEYGYELYIDNSHPLFKYIKNNEKIISRNLSLNILELYPENEFNYEAIYYNLHCEFLSKKSFIVATNSFYTINSDINSKNDVPMLNWGPISDDCRLFLKNTFRPSLEIENKIDYIFNSVYNIKRDNYAVIHLRFGDKCLNNNEFDVIAYHTYFFTITNLLIRNPNKDIKFILISDSSSIAKKLHDGIKKLYYWENNKVHLGDLYNNSDDSGILDTLVDFFIMSGSKHIISNGSGFSKVVSLIYDINYSVI